MQRFIHALPTTLRRHKLIRALAYVNSFLDPASRVQMIRFNGDARAFVDVREGNLRTVMISGSFDPGYFEIATAFLKDGGTYFDVGANVGLCSFGLAPRLPGVHYHLFEANPQLWPLLRRSMALHAGVDFRLVEAGVGEQSRAIQLQVTNRDHDNGQAFVISGASAGTGSVPTRMITLDEYLTERAIGRADFTKMDIEGYECFALAGARQAVAAGKLPVIYFELKAALVARHGKTVADVLAQFRAAGYSLFHLRERPDTPADAPWPLEIAGLPVAPVDRYPDSFSSDVLAVHASAPQPAPRRWPRVRCTRSASR